MEESVSGLSAMILEAFEMGEKDMKSFSPLTLAYIGDAIYDLIIRTMMVEKGNAPVNKLHKKTSSFVKAPAQAELFTKIESELTEDEKAVYMRGRNAKSYTTAKNATIKDYRIATGVECVMGYLYLTNQMTRILELMKIGLSPQKQGSPECGETCEK